jgi:hypothetical protein
MSCENIFISGMDKSEIFLRPLLIYDDKCFSCTQFANIARVLSGGYIRIAGHYYSDEALQAKKIVFPASYETTNMFWLINRNGAYGARSGLLQVIREIIISLIKRRYAKSETKISSYKSKCQLNSCGSPTKTLKRIASLMVNSKKFTFKNR